MKQLALTAALVLLTSMCPGQQAPPRKTMVLRGETYKLFTDAERRQRGFPVEDIRPVNNAATYYIDAINRYVELPDDGPVKGQYNRVLQDGWADDHPELAAWLKQNRRTIELVGQGAGKKEYEFPIIYSRMISGVLMPHLMHFRELARLLVVDAHHQARLGRGHRAAARLETLCRAIGHWRQEPFLIGGLVSLACTQLAADHTVQVLQQYVLDKKSVARINAAVAWLDGHRPSFEYAIENESRFGLQTVDELVEGALDPGAMFIGMPQRAFPENLIRSIGGTRGVKLMMPDRTVKQNMQTYYDKVLAMDKLPAHEVVGPKMDRRARQWMAELPPWDMVSRMMLPALARTPQSYARADARVDLVRLVTALHLYRAENGSFPVRLKQLAPDYLDAVPVDRFSKQGEPLQYKNHAGRGYTVYSIGPDLRDQGGLPGDTPETGDMVYSYSVKEAGQ